MTPNNTADESTWEREREREREREGGVTKGEIVAAVLKLTVLLAQSTGLTPEVDAAISTAALRHSILSLELWPISARVYKLTTGEGHKQRVQCPAHSTCCIPSHSTNTFCQLSCFHIPSARTFQHARFNYNLFKLSVKKIKYQFILTVTVIVAYQYQLVAAKLILL